MSDVQRDVTADELDALPSGAIVLRYCGGDVRPMQKWGPWTDALGAWSVLGENAEFQTAAMVNYFPVDRFVLVYVPDTAKDRS